MIEGSRPKNYFPAHRRITEIASARRAELGPIVLELQQQGLRLNEIAAELSARGIPTSRGGRWHKTTVARLLLTTTPKKD